MGLYHISSLAGTFEGVGRQCIAGSVIDFCSSAVLFGHGSDGVKAPRNGAFYVGK